MSIIALITAAISGIFMAIQGSLNTALGKITGLLEATFLVHIIGSIFAFLLLLVGLGEKKFDMLLKAPWYTYLGGILGVGIVYLVVFSINKIGVASATTAIIVGQVSMAMVADHFGLFGLESVPFNYWKIGGLLLLAAGAWLLLKR
ncbi:MAG: DMT family transporter [Firmicutes bacterium]|nr:DMT family transporter [Bacillota bacterium]